MPLLFNILSRFVIAFLPRSKCLLISWLFSPSILHEVNYIFPCSSVNKESACSAGDLGLTPGLGRSPGKGNGNPLQYSCLENSRGFQRSLVATVHGVAKSGTRLC